MAVGTTYAATEARKLFASTERRVQLDDERRLRTAEQVAERLGGMKGALMKVGQMASYVDDGLPEPVRQALATLQAGAPPMSADLAADVVERGSDALPTSCSWSGIRSRSPRHRSARSTALSPSTLRTGANGRSP